MPDPPTRRLPGGVLETSLSGKVSVATLDGMFRARAAAGNPPTWLIDATAATGYEPQAINRAVGLFREAAGRDLRVLVAAVADPIVRMGAQTVRFSVKLLHPALRFELVDSLDAAIALLARLD